MIRFEDAPDPESKPAKKPKAAPAHPQAAPAADPAAVDPGGSSKNADAAAGLDLGDSPSKGRAKRKAPMRRAKKG